MLSTYRGFFKGYLSLRGERNLDKQDYRPLFIGTHWPSIALVLPWEQGPKIAGDDARDDDAEKIRATIGLGLAAGNAEQFYKLTERESLTGEEARELARILQHFYLGVADGSSSAPDTDRIVAAWRDLEAGTREPAPDYDAPPGKFGAESQYTPEAAVQEITQQGSGGKASFVHSIIKDETREVSGHWHHSSAG